MKRTLRRDPFTQGYLAVDFPARQFDSAARLLLEATQLFFRRFTFLALLTLAVFLPGKALLHLVCYLAGVPANGLLMYLLMDASDLVLASLATPAVIYGLVGGLRDGFLPPFAECLRWGRRQWAKSLWNKFKVEVTIALWGALLVVPGVIKMVQLMLTDPIVAIEADACRGVLERSRALTRGHGWRILLVLLPVVVMEFAVTLLVLRTVPGGEPARPLLALIDSLLSVGGQWATAVALCLYLALAGNES